MKKLVLTMVAFVAMTTASYAQYNDVFKILSSQSVSSYSYNAPPSRTVYSTNLNTINVNGYYRNTGTYVESHVRTVPNNTNWDNFSTKGNSNPFTGSTGYRAKDYSRDAYNYGAGHTIHTGVRGGQYYNNNNGNRTYVPKRNLW